MQLQERMDIALKYIRSITDFSPDIGLVLGSGLGEYANHIESPVYIPYADIPHFPAPTVEGHAGRFVLGTHLGKRIIAMQGRLHFYEGYTQSEITLPIRIMKQMGVQKLLLTNAAGGTNPVVPIGSLMLISDHINYSGSNPLLGPNLDALGPRFPDMSHVYSPELRCKLYDQAAAAGIILTEGVYMMFSGPCYETPSEVKMAQILGANAVGMSTVPEAIVAKHMGMDVIGISCITNLAAGMGKNVLSHQEVIETSARVQDTFLRLLDILLLEVF